MSYYGFEKHEYTNGSLVSDSWPASIRQQNNSLQNTGNHVQVICTWTVSKGCPTLHLNVLLQYIQDKQEVTLNDRFGAHIGPSSDFSDIQAGMSGMRSKPAVPWHPVYVSVAAEQDIHIL